MTTPFHHDPNTDIGLPIDPYPVDEKWMVELTSYQTDHRAGKHATVNTDCWVCLEGLDPYEELNPPTKTVWRVMIGSEHYGDELGQDFETEEAAAFAGEDWFHEMVAIDPNPEDAVEDYYYEVYEKEVPDTTPPDDEQADWESSYWQEVTRR